MSLPEQPTHRAEVRSRFCADRLVLGLRIEEGVVRAVGWEGLACRVCATSAELLCTQAHGLPVGELAGLTGALERALAGQTDGPFGELAGTPVGRLACARLAHQALERALHGGSDPERAGAEVLPADVDAWEVVRRWRTEGLDVAVATLIEVVGSAPCPVGSHLVVGSDGRFWGAVSGGCVESSVVREALDLLQTDRKARVLDLQIANSQAGSASLPCGGQIRVHVAVGPGLRALRRYRGRGVVRRVELAGAETVVPGQLAAARLTGAVFEEPLNDRPHLVLVGGTAVAQHLEVLAGTVGYRVTIVEPRPGFAAAGRFRSPVVDALPGEWLADQLDADTAVLMLTHEPELDDPGLCVALPSPAFYVGALGSRKTQRARLERLRTQGLSEADLARLHGPAGVAIGAVGPAEIALSMLAEVVAVRRQAVPELVGGVVLAAGSSRRAGAVNKLLVPVEGEPMVRRVVQNALSAGVGPLVVVLGHQAEAVRAVLADLPVQFIVNPDHGEGMGRSIAVGIEALAVHRVSGALVLLGDMPWVRPTDLHALVAAHRPATRHHIVAPHGPEGRRGNPVLWPATAFPDLQRLQGDVGGRGLLERAAEAVIPVVVAHDGIFRDLDQPVRPG